jgi:hypothetical protein
MNEFFIWFASDVTGADLSGVQIEPDDDEIKLVVEIQRHLSAFQFEIFERALRQWKRYNEKFNEFAIKEAYTPR